MIRSTTPSTAASSALVDLQLMTVESCGDGEWQTGSLANPSQGRRNGSQVYGPVSRLTFLAHCLDCRARLSIVALLLTLARSRYADPGATPRFNFILASRNSAIGFADSQIDTDNFIAVRKLGVISVNFNSVLMPADRSTLQSDSGRCLYHPLSPSCGKQHPVSERKCPSAATHWEVCSPAATITCRTRDHDTDKFQCVAACQEHSPVVCRMQAAAIPLAAKLEKCARCSGGSPIRGGPVHASKANVTPIIIVPRMGKLMVSPHGGLYYIVVVWSILLIGGFLVLQLSPSRPRTVVQVYPSERFSTASLAIDSPFMPESGITEATQTILLASSAQSGLRKILAKIRPGLRHKLESKLDLATKPAALSPTRTANIVAAKDHAAYKVLKGKVDSSITFCNRLNLSKYRDTEEKALINIVSETAHTPRTVQEVNRRAISLPRAINRRAVKEPTQQALKALHRCVNPVFINRTSASVALVSLPGSGNTWMRYLIEQATGVLTGSVYGDKRLYQAGLIGENVTTAHVAVVKYHTGGVTSDPWYCPDTHGVGSAILLIRNPYDAMMSEFNRKLTGSHTAAASALIFDVYAESWLALVKNMMARFSELVNAWVLKGVPLHVVYFEDLVNETRQQILKAVTFLQLPTTVERLDCVMANKDGPFRRKHHPSDVGGARHRQQFLTDEVVKLTDCSLRKVDKVLPGIYKRYSKRKFCLPGKR